VLCTAAQLPPATAWRDRARTVRADGARAVAEAVAARWFTPDYLRDNPDTRRHFEDMVAGTPAEGYAACCEAIAELDLRAALPDITAPTLAIAGADDPATPVDKLAEIADLIAGCELRVIDHAAHLANVEQPARITEALVNHLEKP
jgi:3-oxoadipate enol-lactonase